MKTSIKTGGNLSDFTQSAVFFVSLILSKIDPLSFKVKSILESADFRIWVKDQFNVAPTHRKKKSLLLKILNSNLDVETFAQYIEFGVAYGETAEFIGKNAKGNYSYSGFDTFEGLPEPWRRLKIGEFSNSGKLPTIGLENFTFHKGLIQETFQEIQFMEDSRKIILFDFDLFEPTLFAFLHCLPYLKKGDILYFDEAFDYGERLIIENYVLKNVTVKFFAATSLSLALVIVDTK